MNLNKEQYCEMVEKLADEAIDNAYEKEAAEAQEMVEKAAAVYDYAMNKIAMAQEVYTEAEAEVGQCLEVLASAGILDENGFNKEAAEEDEEVYEATCKVAYMHDEAIEKMASAEEVYNESVIEAQAAEEVLNAFGIEL